MMTLVILASSLLMIVIGMVLLKAHGVALLGIGALFAASGFAQRACVLDGSGSLCLGLGPVCRPRCSPSPWCSWCRACSSWRCGCGVRA